VHERDSEVIAFEFRSWIRRSCKRAMVWGLGVVALFGLVAWVLSSPGSAPMSRAFGVLVLYGSLFWVTLAKIWITAASPAVVLDSTSLSYQPLHGFRRRAIPLQSVVMCGPREGTQSLRIVHEAGRGRAKEFFLNLGVVNGRNEFLDELGRRLEEEGLIPTPGERNAWRRKDLQGLPE